MLTLPLTFTLALATAPSSPATFETDAQDLESEWKKHVVGVVFKEPFEFDAGLSLYDDDRFRLVVDVRIGDDDEHEVVTGTYRWRGETLELREENGDVQRLKLQNDSLVLETDWKLDVIRELLGLPDLDFRRVR